MGMAGTYLLGSLNITTGLLSVFSILLYAFAYTPLKRKSPIAVFVGAIPGALPPLIGYVAAHGKIDQVALLYYSRMQFVWQFPHFWAIAWVLDDDYKLAGFRLLPTGGRDKGQRRYYLFIYPDIGAGKFVANYLRLRRLLCRRRIITVQFDIFIPGICTFAHLRD
jgi:heme O synthase-like polyprenyltransferase